MNKLLVTMKNGVADFARDEEGAQVVEYALVIAVVSIAMVLAMNTGIAGAFTGWFTRIATCLTGTCV